MSLSLALSSALSGLTATGRRAEVVSTNVANANTPGYVRREVVVGARQVGDTGNGVRVNAVTRDADLVLIADRRLAGADAGGRDIIADFLARAEAAVGTTDSETSVGARVAALESALIAASARPDSESQLAQVADAVRGLADHLARATDQIQEARRAADTRIATEVASLNDGLHRVAQLNVQIRSYTQSGRDVATLMDQRQQVVDSISAIIPLREAVRDNGQIALYSTGGTALLEVQEVTFQFDASGVITPDMTLDSAALSGLIVDGRLIRSTEPGPIAGGTLSALFRVRDELATGAQAQLDAVARDLVERLSGSGLDPTRAPGDPGLITDGANAFDPLDEVGLAGRLQLNAAADPRKGGGLWRLRDGLGAVAPGATGNPDLLTAMHGALTAARQPVSGPFMVGARSLATLAADMLSQVATSRLSADTEASFSTARSDALIKMELEGGVDTDHELQDLMLIEQSYAANAKVIKSVDDLLQILLEI